MAAVEVDIPQLAAFCSLPQPTIKNLVDAPTAELVQSLLRNVSAKVTRYNELESEKLRSGIELESAIRGQETKTKSLRIQLDRSNAEVAELKSELQVEQSIKASVETELKELKSTTSTSSSEIHDLNSRVETLEASNREKLSLLECKSTAYDSIVSELNDRHQKSLDQRKQLSAVEQSLEEERSALSAAKFKEQNLKQTIEQLEKRNEYLDGELKSRSNEYTKFRKDKHQEIAALERQNEDDATRVRQLSNTEANLKRTVEELSEKADERSQRMQILQEELLQKENSFQLELDAANRLARLRENSAITERNRVQDLTDQIDQDRQAHNAELGRMQAELETEHNAKEEGETKIAELEVVVEQLRDETTDLRAQDRPPATPTRGLNGFSAQSPESQPSTPRVFSPGSLGVKANLSVTRLFSDNNDLKRLLAVERRKNEDLTGTINGLVADMERQAPEIEELKNEHSRYESEVTELSSLVDTIGVERDQTLKALKKQEGQIDAKVKEGEILRQQLRDLGAQIRVVLMEAHLREQGQQNISAQSRVQLDQLAKNQFQEVDEGVTDTDKYISTNLVAFRNIAELQEQNTQLLQLTRELGERMEHEEGLRKQAEAAHNWEDLQQKYERCKEEMKSLAVQSQSYIRERDMFRSILEHRGQANDTAESTSNNGRRLSSNAANAPIVHSIEAVSAAEDQTDYVKLLKDMQNHFDAYRNEAATDRVTLKQQIEDLSKSNSELRTEASRGSNQVMLAHDRYEMLQTNFTMLKNENAELQKRTQEFFESSARQDIRVQQAVEDLVEARSLIDSLRNENANLKAEKEFWKSVEKRIMDDNEALIQERSRLNSMNTSLQSLMNEREHADSESRRKLQSQIENLEADLQKTSANLREEVEESKRSISRREFDAAQSQKRVDDLMASLSRAREELAKSTTAKDHLSRQVDDMVIELRSAKERLDVFNSAHSMPEQSSTLTSNGNSVMQVSEEQGLKVRISELQRDLDLAKKDTNDLQSQVEQYKAISQASEDNLQNMNETQEMFRKETETIIEEEKERIANLELQLRDVSEELASINRENEELRNKQTEHQHSLNEQRKEFELKLNQLKDEDERHAAAAQFLQQDLRAQADIAQQAQQNYESELVKHADAATALRKYRTDFDELKVQLAKAKAEAKTARQNQEQSEESWGETKVRFEREINDLNTARRDLKIQNDRLHEQLETLSTARKRIGEAPSNSDSDAAISGLENLQEVVKYLRREKEMVDVQLDLSTQEAKRLRQQLDYTQAQLDDARLKSQQQSRIDADNASSALAHQKLMDTIQDLNTLRESNVTLRAEARQAQTNLTTRVKEVEDLRAQIEPLQDELQELKGESEAHEGEVKLLKENADRWQQRAQNVLQKYDRVDPTEYEALKEQIQKLETERNEIVSAREAAQQQLEAANVQVTRIQEQSNERIETMRTKMTDQFKARSKAQGERIKEKDTQLQKAAGEKEALEIRVASLVSVESELEATKAERDEAVKNLATIKNDVPAQGQHDEEGEVNEQGDEDSANAHIKALQASLEESQTKTAREEQNAAGLRSRLLEQEARVAALTEELSRLQTERDTAREELARLKASQTQGNEASKNDMLNQELRTLKEALSEARKDGPQQKDPIQVNLNSNLPEETSTDSISEQIKQQVEAARLELQKRLEEGYQKRADGMKAQLNKKLNDARLQIRQSLDAEHNQASQASETQHQQQIDHLQSRIKSLEAEINGLKTDSAKTDETSAASQQADGIKEKQAPGPKWQPTEQEARALMQSHEIMRNIVKANIQSHVKKQNEILATKLKEEHAKDMAEAQAKAATAKEHAVLMENKKTAVQLNMANNKANTSQFKLELVEKAAQSTPDKAVKEIWDIVKASKLPRPDLKQTPKTAASIADGSGRPSQARTDKPQDIQDQGSASTAAAFGKPTSDEHGKPPSSPTTEQQGESGQASGPSSNSSQQPPSSGIPTKQQPASGLPTASNATTTTRLPQSALPVARGGANRGSQRGRGSSVGGRGGAGLDTKKAQNAPQGRGSPASGGLNPSARQFVPGNKRPRDEPQGLPQDAEGTGKRIKGGGTTS